MGNLGRGEVEDALFRAMKALTMKVFAKLLQDRREGTHPEVQELDFQRFTYMQRWGGPNARGYELVLTFRENYSLLLTQEDFK